MNTGEFEIVMASRNGSRFEDYVQALIHLQAKTLTALRVVFIPVFFILDFFVMPQTGHGLTGSNYDVDGNGRAIVSLPISNRYDQFGLLVDWVENNTAPGKSVTVTAGERSLPLCSYPAYPRYRAGAPALAGSYECATAQAR